MIVAGEASGDIYGADLAREAFKIDPDIHFFGIGGARMREAGVETLVDSADMAVVGLVEVLKHFNVISDAFLKLKQILLNNRPDLLILIDYPGFNLRLAKIARKAGVRVLYYISPQIWAWRQGRVKKIARLVDHMAVILPFEAPFYERAGVPVSFVGHPMLDMVSVNMDRSQAAASFGLDPARKIVGLFPGSRKNELDRLLPVIIGAAVQLKSRFPDIRFVLPLASTLNADSITPQLAEAGLDVTITRDRIHELIRACDAVISVSGTVTLEIALVGTPMVIIYKLSPLTYQLAKRLVKVPNIGLCNIVAGETVVRELIQDEANAVNISAEIGTILSDDGYDGTIRHKLAQVRSRLGCGGASQNVARLIFTLMRNQ
ncbi:MAG: lipid-A-disaccharide synthase [Geobacteraceae bacterium GWC2_55_20]|nr:lipid-A-disaccharide synthase [Deltaproteobacteria bacterium]OGU01361.1 MAG: lipid-A-disaccharide synthase [Geobacteraceae bacterium GWC2_55_20]OGU22727.1 MAG: lipid-A-disaccharide synthase [Geobacteraceae bacterium GWF2_54_21]HCE67307.1 lipid-A-disaccharide synthase [Geobacter sp.]